jgi:hypothetical protein
MYIIYGMKKECLYCKKPVNNKFCGVSCQNKYQKKGIPINKKSIEKMKITISSSWKKFEVSCYKCNKLFQIEEYNTEKPKKDKYYCSKSCSNSRLWSEEKRKKLSETCKNSEKVKKANLTIGNNARLKRGEQKKLLPSIYCLHCKNIIENPKSGNRKYHKECWLKCSGGIREGTSRGKSGIYKGYRCDSSYELAWVIYQIDHNIGFRRNHKGFDYDYLGKMRKFYPDFILDKGSYVEIKNYRSDITNSKIKYFPDSIEILYKEDIKEKILPYIISVYGKNFIQMYE